MRKLFTLLFKYTDKMNVIQKTILLLPMSIVIYFAMYVIFSTVEATIIPKLSYDDVDTLALISTVLSISFIAIRLFKSGVSK
jgi:antibiotic biosynthesis monooxygenase (ABM) superfamily enzyme